MQLTQKVLKAINNPITRRRLMDVLGCTEFTISRYILKNSDNLTKAAALHVIREVTGLADNEILENKNEFVPLHVRNSGGSNG